MAPALAYRYLEAAGPEDFAWEWLRRAPGYPQSGPPSACPGPGGVTIVHAAPPSCTARWGCLNLPDTGETYMEARILWSAAVDPSILRVLALSSPDRDGPTFDLSQCGVAATVVRRAECEHVLLRDTRSAVRLDVLSGTLLDGPVRLFHDFAGTGEGGPVIAALRRFLFMRETRRFPDRSLHSTQRRLRQITALRVHDTLVQGASIRDVGVMLFGTQRIDNEWADEALKSQCRRLIALARTMVSGGYLSLLR